MRWHLISGNRGDDSYTEAMKVGGDVLVRTTATCLAYEPVTGESYTSGIAVSTVVVEGLDIVHRWVVEDVEAHEDEETGEHVDAHARWSVEVKIGQYINSRAGIVKRLADLALVDGDGDPHDDIDGLRRSALTQWLPIHQELVHPVSHS